MQRGFRVMDAMTVRPVVASARATIADVAALMDRHDVGTVIVKDADDVLGIISEADIVRRGILEGHDVRNALAVKVMTRDLITVSPGMDLLDVIILMKDTNIHTLPVVDDAKMVGFVTAKDILRLEPDLFDTLVESFHLRETERKLVRRSDE